MFKFKMGGAAPLKLSQETGGERRTSLDKLISWRIYGSLRCVEKQEILIEKFRTKSTQEAVRWKTKYNYSEGTSSKQ